MNQEEEYILMAATWFDDGKVHNFQPKNIDRGLVYIGFNHAMIFQLVGGSVKQRQEDFSIYEKEQGFITSCNRFVDRYEALKIATKQGQVGKKYSYSEERLFSEDLLYNQLSWEKVKIIEK